MRTHNARNERTKRKYYDWLKEARGRSEATVDQVASSIDRFEAYTKHADFAVFHTEKVKAFKQHVVDQVSERTGERLSHSDLLYATLQRLAGLRSSGWRANRATSNRSRSVNWESLHAQPASPAGIAEAHGPSLRADAMRTCAASFS